MTINEDCDEIDPADIPDLQTDVGQSHTSASGTTATGLSSSHTIVQKRVCLANLNRKQSLLFYFVRDWALQVANGENVKPFHIFLTGGAGTGKSYLIKCIFQELDKILPHQSGNPDSLTELLVAPTGTAAFNILGQTIHSAFSVNRTTSKTLAEDQANSLRSKYQDLQLLIIDEVSMLTQWLLETIHCRLQQIKQPSKPSQVYFGNVSILAVGDFHQVPPVKGKLVCMQDDILTDLWNLFHIWELDEVVRQQGDLPFINMLNRIRKKPKSEPLSAEDEELLQSCLVSRSNENYPWEALHIYSTNQQLKEHNEARLSDLSETTPLTTITAADVCLTSTSNKTYVKKTPSEIKDATLPTRVVLCHGARVMLCTNVDVPDGLSNGVIGTVSLIIPGTGPLDLPAAVCVRFDNEQVGRQSRTSLPSPRAADPLSTVIKPQT